jgi:DNA-binding LacI/PurR family transcriptional regulator
MPTLEKKSRTKRLVNERAKYPQLVDFLSSQIDQGKLEVGDRLPPFVELQAEFGVTPNTVNRAMIELEQLGLVERRHGSGVYVASPQERLRTGVIGIIGGGFDFTEYSHYWASVLKGIRQGAREAKLQVLLLDQESDANWDNIDGVIFCDWGRTKILKHMPPKMPGVSVLARTANYPSVTADDYCGTQAAIEHLIDLGHRKIAGLYRNNPQYVLDRRMGAYESTLLAHGIEPEMKWRYELSWIGDDRYDYGRRFKQVGYDSMQKWITDGWQALNCTAILAQNDEVAIGVIEALRANNIRVPEDVSVIGFDGTHDESYFAPSLTTVRVPLAEISCAAVEMLQEQINNSSYKCRHQEFRTHLSIGESTSVSPALKHEPLKNKTSNSNRAKTAAS